MNRIEAMLFERMTVRRWCVAMLGASVLFGAGGYLAGREEVKAQVREATSEVTAGLDKLEAWGKRYSAEQQAKQQPTTRQIGGR